MRIRIFDKKRSIFLEFPLEDDYEKKRWIFWSKYPFNSVETKDDPEDVRKVF